MSWIQTYTGVAFDLETPKVEDVNIEDIAHALSNLCRFAGHSNHFYSVAEHSVLCSNAPGLSDEDRFVALMHDAPEAYVVDVPQPLKVMLPQYQVVEARVADVVAEKFGFQLPLSAAVKEADRRMLATERLVVHRTAPKPWHVSVEEAEPYPEIHISFLTPFAAKMRFLKRFRELNALR